MSVNNTVPQCIVACALVPGSDQETFPSLPLTSLFAQKNCFFFSFEGATCPHLSRLFTFVLLFKWNDFYLSVPSTSKDHT